MAEPIDPTRWNVSASAEWRKRLTKEPAGERALVALESFVPFGDDDAGAESLMDRMRTISEVRSPEVCDLAQVVRADGGVRLINRCPAGTSSLTDLMASGAEMHEAEVALVIASVSRALDALHDSGACHGAVGIESILIKPDGQAIVRGAGIAAGADAGDDSRALVDLLDTLTGDGPVSGAIARARLVAMSDDAVTQGSLGEAMARLAGDSMIDYLERCAASRADGLVDAGGIDALKAMHELMSSPPARRGPGRADGPRPKRKPKQRLPIPRRIVGGLAFGAVVAIAWVVMSPLGDDDVAMGSVTESTAPSSTAAGEPSQTAGPNPTVHSPTAHGPTAPASASAAGEPDWARVVADLDMRRQRAFDLGDPSVLTDVYTDGSSALRTDLEVLSSLRAANARPVGLRTDIEAVTALATSGDSATLEVIDRRSAYDLVGAAPNDLIEHVAARGPTLWRVEVVRAGENWLISSVSAGQRRPER